MLLAGYSSSFSLADAENRAASDMDPPWLGEQAQVTTASGTGTVSESWESLVSFVCEALGWNPLYNLVCDILMSACLWLAFSFLFFQSINVGRGARKRVSTASTTRSQQDANGIFYVENIIYVYLEDSNKWNIEITLNATILE